MHKIFVVDPDRAVLAAAVRALRLAPVFVVTTTSPEQALVLLREVPPHQIIADANLFSSALMPRIRRVMGREFPVVLLVDRRMDSVGLRRIWTEAATVFDSVVLLERPFSDDEIVGAIRPYVELNARMIPPHP